MRKVTVQHFVGGECDFKVEVTLKKNRPPFLSRAEARKFMLNEPVLIGEKSEHMVLSFTDGAYLFTREELVGSSDG